MVTGFCMCVLEFFLPFMLRCKQITYILDFRHSAEQLSSLIKFTDQPVFTGVWRVLHRPCCHIVLRFLQTVNKSTRSKDILDVEEVVCHSHVLKHCSCVSCKNPVLYHIPNNLTSGSVFFVLADLMKMNFHCLPLCIHLRLNGKVKVTVGWPNFFRFIRLSKQKTK